LRKRDVGAWTGSIWHRIGTGECGNELLGSIKCGEFLGYLRTGYLLKKDCASWSKYVI